ncbi:MAG: phage tail tape measure protein [Alphaproteobacteria bacterium]|nr:phage tail tape measure protein [Alphaproteobacteria bacterium]
MSELERVLVRIEGDTSKLRAALQNAKYDVSGFGNSAEKLRGQFQQMDATMAPLQARFLGLLGVVGGGAGLVQFGRHVIDVVGGLGELSQQVGLSIEQYQVYTAVALQAGASQEQFVTGVQKLTRTIEEAMQGGDSAIDKFKRYGISLLDVNGKQRETGDILQDLAVRIAGAATETERGKIAYDMFGRSGQNLIPMLMEMSSGYAKNAEEAKKLGMVVGDELTQKYDALGDAMERGKIKAVVWGAEFGDAVWNVAKLPWDGIVAGIDAVGNALDSAEIARVNALESVGMASKRDIASRDKIVARRFSNDIPPPPAANTNAADAGPVRLPVSESDTKKIEKQAEAWKKVSDQLGFQIEQTQRSEREQAIHTALQQAGTDITTRHGQAIAQKAAILFEEQQLVKDDAEAIQEMERAMLSAISADDQRNKKRLETLASYEREISDNEKLAAALMNGNQAYAEEALYLEIVNRLKAEGSELTEQEIEQARNISKTIVAQRADIDRLRESTDFFGKVGERAFQRMGDESTRMWVRGQGDAVKWRNVVGGVLSEVYQEMLKLTILNPVKSAFSGAISGGDLLGGLSNLFGGGGSGLGDWGFSTGMETAVAHGGGDVGLGTGRTARVASSVFAGAKRYHNGVMNLGVNEVPIIAEKGERIQTVAQQRAQARQISDLRARAYQAPTLSRAAPSGGNSIIVNQTMNVQAGVSQTVRAEMMAMLPQIKKETEAAVAARVARGGSYASNFRR